MFCPSSGKNTGFSSRVFHLPRSGASASSLNEVDAVLSSWSARGREPTEKAASEASLKLFLKTGRVERRASARADTAGTVVDGLKNSISDFTSNEQIKGASSKDVVDLLLITQYFDMLNAIGTRPDTQTVFIDEDGE